MKDFDWQILSALYATRNITRTARLLFTGQPNVTKRIKSMEKELGVPIITRTSSGVCLTEQGEILAQHAIEIDRRIREAYEAVQNSSADVTGTIRIVAPNSFVRAKLPAILKTYRETHPETAFQLLTCLSDDVPHYLKSGEIDIAFTHAETDGFPYSVLYDREELYLVSRDSIDLAQLPRQSQIDYTRSESTRKKINQWWRERYGVPQQIVLTMNNIDTCFETVSKGLGYAFFFGTAYLDAQAELNRCAICEKDGKPLTRHTWVICSDAGYRRRAVQEFLRFVDTTRELT